MACEEKARLFDKYNVLRTELFRAATALASMARTHASDYATLSVKLAALQARQDAEQARIAYRRHVSEHGC